METGLEAIPEVHRWPYDYSKTDENGEYIIPGQGILSLRPYPYLRVRWKCALIS